MSPAFSQEQRFNHIEYGSTLPSYSVFGFGFFVTTIIVYVQVLTGRAQRLMAQIVSHQT